jgi:O-antigen/teichoic acid export membrane protein
MLLGWQDRFFLTKYYSLEEVAEYSTVYRLADLHGVFVSAFVAAFAPILWSVSNKNKKKSMELFKHIISVSSLLGCLGVCISVIIGPILLPPKYQAALVIIPYLAIGLIFGSFASLYGLILEYKALLNDSRCNCKFFTYLLYYRRVWNSRIINLNDDRVLCCFSC